MQIEISENQPYVEKYIVIIICLSIFAVLTITLVWVLFYWYRRFQMAKDRRPLRFTDLAAIIIAVAVIIYF